MKNDKKLWKRREKIKMEETEGKGTKKKQTETKQGKWSKMKQNEAKGCKTKQNETKGSKTKQNEETRRTHNEKRQKNMKTMRKN